MGAASAYRLARINHRCTLGFIPSLDQMYVVGFAKPSGDSEICHIELSLRCLHTGCGRAILFKKGLPKRQKMIYAYGSKLAKRGSGKTNDYARGFLEDLKEVQHGEVGSKKRYAEHDKAQQ